MSLAFHDDSIEFVTYTDEEMLGEIRRLVSADLSEPYSVFVYRYFIHQWPQLCICAYTVDPFSHMRKEMIAVIVNKAENEAGVLKGYIAMLAVNKLHRKKGLGLELVNRGIARMVDLGCDEIFLEAEESNLGALRLYERLGFMRDEKLGRYYLNGSNAYRLKLWVGDEYGSAVARETLPQFSDGLKKETRAEQTP
jgi:peptide alpha-N-acetyltransferase